MSKLADWIRKKRPDLCSAVVVAAGSSQRMGEDKMFMDLDGVPVLIRTLDALNRFACVEEIILVTRPEHIEELALKCRERGLLKVTKVICGGATRVESALAGVSEISRSARLAAVHDGARPLVTKELFYAAVHAAALHKSAVPAVPVADTVKRTQGEKTSETLDRDSLVYVQTPQVFYPELIKAALTKAVQEGVSYTDDSAAVEALGVPTYLTPGSPENIKLTTPLDLELARAILRSRAAE